MDIIDARSLCLQVYFTVAVIDFEAVSKFLCSYSHQIALPVVVVVAESGRISLAAKLLLDVVVLAKLCYLSFSFAS